MQETLKLIDYIYAAGADPRCWSDFCHELHQQMGATSVNLVLMCEENPSLLTSFATGASQEDSQYYQENVFAIDETWVLAALAGIVIGAVWNYAVTMTYTWKKPASN